MLSPSTLIMGLYLHLTQCGSVGETNLCAKRAHDRFSRLARLLER